MTGQPAPARVWPPVRYDRRARTHTWQCPDCPARYADGWGGSDTSRRRRQHIAITHSR
jgi:hypothetical protein